MNKAAEEKIKLTKKEILDLIQILSEYGDFTSTNSDSATDRRYWNGLSARNARLSKKLRLIRDYKPSLLQKDTSITESNRAFALEVLKDIDNLIKIINRESGNAKLSRGWARDELLKIRAKLERGEI